MGAGMKLATALPSRDPLAKGRQGSLWLRQFLVAPAWPNGGGWIHRERPVPDRILSGGANHGAQLLVQPRMVAKERLGGLGQFDGIRRLKFLHHAWSVLDLEQMGNRPAPGGNACGSKFPPCGRTT